MSLSAGPGAVIQTRGAELTAESQAAGCSGRAVTYLPIIWMKMEVQSECKSFKEKFLKCLHENNFENALCRKESKEYLECRMERQLMAQEPLEKLGFGDLVDGKSETKTKF
ncbi:Cytochrome c oxidase assembly protein COX19 [Pteropus alecto]|uniref:Cytochrome c oxidase assembly protein COX19 n=1 Tax=Pteropus alecto TaxID=9402 RepID=L5KEJ0_PTEAL|nr:Cytochrome c oxidase assembly protein COX19 [Pteropus alecto]